MKNETQVVICDTSYVLTYPKQHISHIYTQHTYTEKIEVEVQRNGRKSNRLKELIKENLSLIGNILILKGECIVCYLNNKSTTSRLGLALTCMA